MRGGYIGHRTRRKRFYQFLFILFVLILAPLIFFINSIAPFEDETEQQKNKVYGETELYSLEQLENKLIEKEQRLQLRDNFIISLQEQNDILEKNNIKLNKDNLKKNKDLDLLLDSQLDSQNENLLKIEVLENTINEFNKKIKNINDNYFDVKKEYTIIETQLDKIKSNSNSLELQNKNSFEKIEELNNIIEELNKIIIEKNELIYTLRDKFHH